MIRRHRESGFTLLELLVAMTLLGVLMAALFGALRLGNRVWETGAAQLDAGARIQVVQEFLRHQLGQTVPMVDLADNRRSSGEMLFQGTGPSLRFVSMLPEQLGAGASIMELALQESTRNEGSGDLVIRISPLDVTTGDQSALPTEDRVLIEGIEGIEITYFGSENTNTTAEWWQGWQNQRSLPRLVRVQVDFPPGDRRTWPELIIAMMVDLPPAFQL